MASEISYQLPGTGVNQISHQDISCPLSEFSEGDQIQPMDIFLYAKKKKLGIERN